MPCKLVLLLSVLSLTANVVWQKKACSFLFRQIKVDGAVNPFQLYTFDFRMRNAQKITRMDTQCFQKVVQLYQYIFGDT